MLRTTLIVCALAATTLAQPRNEQTQPQTQQQLVDVRDLAAALTTIPAQPQQTSAKPSPFTDTTPEVKETRLEMIVGRIGDAMALNYEWLDEGLLVVEGTTDGIAQFNAMLSSLRDLYAETYAIEVTAVDVAVDDLPPLGQPFAVSTTPIYVTRQTVTRRVSTPMISEQRRSFVGDVQPVVGDQSVGFDPTIAEAVSGLDVRVTVGAGEQDERRTPIVVSGVLTRTTIERFDPDSAGISTLPEMPGLELPTVHRRTFTASRKVAYAERTVVAVLDGLEPGRAIAVTVTAVRN